MPRGSSVQQTLCIQLAPATMKSVAALALENNVSENSAVTQLVTEALQARGWPATKTRWALLVDPRCVERGDER
jgi:hypothetical protein